jgi:DNA-binding NtrC family response regulator
LALYNLAEVRLRRGRTAGVESILETSTAKNRHAGNRRGLVRDLELWVRLELTQGRAVAALARCAEARQELEDRSFEGRRGVFEVLAARAHGWLGRRDRAAACLRKAAPEAIRELESEERPAVWALAGRPAEALEEASRTPWAGLWRALLAGGAPRSETWHNLGALEPFRAARLVFDCELARPGVVPADQVRKAISTLRRTGAEMLAEKLESRSLSPWRALESYLARPDLDAAAAADLLTTAGYCDARLSWIRNGREEVVVAGEGGPEVLEAELADGSWVLRTPVADSVLRTLFALIRRDLRPPQKRDTRRRPRAGGNIVGESPVLLTAMERLDQLAEGDLPILLLGESGTGKELFARRAHRLSRRAKRPFLPVNCAALSETLIQSELFGHVKGSFTGADRDRPGFFESVRGGTVFLDEIGDLPLAAQGKLLRLLQEGEIRRVGESFSRKVDVRMVTATHRDLEQMVAEGSFRQDLFYRLKVATVTLPPLRQRDDDILLLADHFLADLGGASAPRLSRRTRNRLLTHPWPGNIRELRNVLEVAAALAGDGEIDAEHLDLPKPPRRFQGSYHHQLFEFRKGILSKALDAAGGNRSQAARHLGLTRQALTYLIRELGLK